MNMSIELTEYRTRCSIIEELLYSPMPKLGVDALCYSVPFLALVGVGEPLT
jgi:hypothetical protein